MPVITGASLGFVQPSKIGPFTLIGSKGMPLFFCVFGRPASGWAVAGDGSAAAPMVCGAEGGAEGDGSGAGGVVDGGKGAGGADAEDESGGAGDGVGAASGDAGDGSAGAAGSAAAEPTGGEGVPALLRAAQRVLHLPGPRSFARRRWFGRGRGVQATDGFRHQLGSGSLGGAAGRCWNSAAGNCDSVGNSGATARFDRENEGGAVISRRLRCSSLRRDGRRLRIAFETGRLHPRPFSGMRRR